MRELNDQTTSRKGENVHPSLLMDNNPRISIGTSWQVVWGVAGEHLPPAKGSPEASTLEASKDPNWCQGL